MRWRGWDEVKREKKKPTLIMQRNNKRPRQRTRKVEVDIRPPIIRHIALLNDPLLLQLLVRKLVRPQHLLLLLLAARALALRAHIVQVVLVRLELPDEIRVVVADRLVHLVELDRLGQHALLERAEVLQLLLDLVAQQAEAVALVDDAQLLQLAEQLHGADALAHHDGVVLGRRRRVRDALQPQRPLGHRRRRRDGAQDLHKDGLGLHEEDLLLRDVERGG